MIILGSKHSIKSSYFLATLVGVNVILISLYLIDNGNISSSRILSWQFGKDLFTLNIAMIALSGLKFSSLGVGFTEAKVSLMLKEGDSFFLNVPFNNWGRAITLNYSLGVPVIKELKDLISDHDLTTVNTQIFVDGVGENLIKSVKQNEVNKIEVPVKLDSIPCKRCNISGYIPMDIEAITMRNKNKKEIQLNLYFEIIGVKN